MPAVYPFRAVQYQGGSGDVSALVAPPYDVLDAKSRAALLAKDAGNVVGIDLPHVPAKELGPPEAYQNAANSYREMLLGGKLERRDRPAIFAYRQNFTFRGEKYQRCGMACCVETQPLGPREGGGVLPHEQTFSGPKEDRLALMKAAQAQFSPIFGMHPDEDGAATALVREIMDSRKADMTADMGDGVTHEVWNVDDEATIAKYADALAGEDIFIADGHHRYNTAVNYLAELESQGSVPESHPARCCMFVMVSMSDPGLAIGPTHRVLSGMQDYSIVRFEEAAGAYLNIEACDNDPLKIEQEMDRRAARAGTANVFGIYDFATGLCYTAVPAEADPLSERFADKPEAWRTLDVALVQHLIVEEICEPELNRGEPVKWAFPHSMPEVLAIGKGEETGAAIAGGGRAQVAIVVRPTPLEAVRDICKANELMPQKSTFFYPKLATGLFINPLA